MRRRHRAAPAVLLAAAIALTSGCASSATTGSGSAPNSPVHVGMIYEKTGLLATYAQEYRQGFTIGLDYATGGTDAVNGHKIDVTWDDDADSATTAVTDFKSLVGAGDNIIAGTVDSDIATQLAPLAAQNKTLYIAGPAAADQITGANQYTFRSGRQTYQDVEAAKSYAAADGPGKTVVVLAQNFAFGQSTATDVEKVFGSVGDHVEPVLVPLTTTDFTPTALQIKAMHPDLIYFAWAGATGAPLAQALMQQGVFATSKVVTGLANIATYPFFGAIGTQFDYISLYFYQASHNAANTYLINQMQSRYHAAPDLFAPDGFVAAQMIVHALQAGSTTDTQAMIKALAGWSFLAPKGQQQIRAADHAMLQPMYLAKLVQNGSSFTPELIKALSDTQTAPPVTANFGG